MLKILYRSEGDAKYINIILAFILIRPHFTFLPTVASVYLFDLIIILMLLIINHKIYCSIVEVLSLTPIIAVILIKAIKIGADSDTILAVCKIGYYFYIFKSLSFMAKDTYKYIDLKKILNFCFGYNVILCTIQLLEFPILANIAHIMYGSNKLRSIWSGYPRIYGTFFNANWFGVYLIFMAAFFTAEFCKKGGKKDFVFKIVLSVYMLLISGSRTAIIGTTIAIMIVLILNKRIKLVIYALLVVIIMAVIGFLVAQKVPLFAKTLNRFTSYFGSMLSEDASISTAAGSRWDEWMNSIGLVMDSPLFGNNLGDIIPHNTYIAVLIRFGIIGFSSLIILVISYFKKIKRIYGIMKIWLLAFHFSFLVVFLSGDYLFTTQIMAMVVAVAAIGYAMSSDILADYEGTI